MYICVLVYTNVRTYVYILLLVYVYYIVLRLAQLDRIRTNQL